MVGAIGLIRRKSKQLKNKLIKQEKDTNKGPEVQYDNDNIISPARHSINLSTDEFQSSPELRSRNSRHSFDLPYARSNNNSRLSLDASFYKNKHHSALNLALPGNRSSMDLGTVIKVPKRGSSPNNNNNMNSANNNIFKLNDGRRKLAEFPSNNLGKSKSVRIKSDSSLPSTTKSRPNSSLFIDAEIPDINKKSDYLVTHISSVLDPSVKNYNNNHINNHSPLILDTHEILHSTGQHNNGKNLGHNHNGTHHKHGHHDHHRRHRHSKNKFEHENETATAFISSSTPFNILFAIFFHVFNIFFTVFIYLPIYICIKMPYLVTLGVIGGIAAFLYYGIGSTTDNNMALNSLNTLNTHAIKG